jgi:hypothetical protein
MKLPLIDTIFTDLEKTSGRKNKVNFLRSHRPNQLMITLLKYTFDSNIRFDLPEGAPPYKENEDLDDDFSGLYGEQRRLYLFLEGGNPDLKPVKRESIFIEVLESIHPKEAKVLIAVKDKKLPYKGLTKKLVEEAFPGLL